MQQAQQQQQKPQPQQAPQRQAPQKVPTPTQQSGCEMERLMAMFNTL